MKLIKYEGNPILKPNPANEWENFSVCNPGAWYENGVFYLLYRAAGDDKAHRISVGLAISRDGFHFERQSDEPVLAPSPHNFDAGCIEDPRIVKLGDTYYITYACRPLPPGQYWLTNAKDPIYISDDEPDIGVTVNLTSSALAATKDFRAYKKLGRMTRADLDDRDVILFPEKVNGKYVRLSRPKEWSGEGYPCEYPAMWISYSDNLLQWDDCRFFAKGGADWEEKIGGSAPPIKTEKGWFMLYHAVGKDGLYRIGAMVLDLNNPERIIARTKEPILEPTESYEFEGLYHGCAFPTGNVVADGTLYVYYGGADHYCCVATAEFDKLLDFVLENGK